VPGGPDSGTSALWKNGVRRDDGGVAGGITMTPVAVPFPPPWANVAVRGRGLPAPVAIPPGEQIRLLELSRVAVASAVGACPAAALDRAVASGPLPRRPAAAFVTLRVDGRLRGCIGSLDETAPVWTSVVRAAISAARHDPRFPAVTPAELPRVDIAVSVLGPLVRLEDHLAFRLGTDGVVVVRGRRQGLLLPEVAAMAGFDRGAMLDACCEKAGLDRGAWRDARTQVLAFRTQRFGGPAVVDRSRAG